MKELTNHQSRNPLGTTSAAVAQEDCPPLNVEGQATAPAVEVFAARTVTAVMALIALLTFAFSFGNIWHLALMLNVPAWIAPLVRSQSGAETPADLITQVLNPTRRYWNGPGGSTTHTARNTAGPSPPTTFAASWPSAAPKPAT
ncbi:hypothetical protein [Nonomuraea helvata]|uniref:Uncharacterized protein n=1 Tax=Nonomuraea helvata TaxID=37484 RepID=A0ABV5SCJ9_9ACTN